MGLLYYITYVECNNNLMDYSFVFVLSWGVNSQHQLIMSKPVKANKQKTNDKYHHSSPMLHWYHLI